MKINLPLFNQLGKKIGKEEITLDEKIIQSRLDLKKIILVLVSRQHQHTNFAKTRGQVKGSNKKPWKQKGTGRARSGSKKSPLWIGGGATFPPQGKRIVKKINQREKQLAIKILLANKIKAEKVILVDKLKFSRPSSKKIYQLFKSVANPKKKTLLITKNNLKNVTLSCRNLANLQFTTAQNVNPLILAQHQMIILTPAAMKNILEK